MASNTNQYQSPDLVNHLRKELRRFDNDDQDGDLFCCLFGAEGYNISNKKAFERKRIQDRLDEELMKPLENPYGAVDTPSTSALPHRYRNDAQVKFYKKKIAELQDDSDVDCMCCLYGADSEAYRTKKILDRQNYERKLEEELEKPLGPTQLPTYSEKAAPVASMGAPSASYRNPQKIQTLKRQINEYEKKMASNESDQDCLVCLCGPSAYAYSTNDLLEKQNLEKKLEREMAKPIDPTIPKDSKAYAAMQAPNEEYQNEARIQSLRNQLREMEDDYSETCCILCFGAEGMAYSAHNDVKKNDLERKLEKELAKPKRNMQRY